jgi:thymidylate kinase
MSCGVKNIMNISTILQSLGLDQGTKEIHTSKLDVLSFKNPDSSVRWFWPAESRQPLFLKFYHLSSWKSQLFSILTKVAFYIGIQQLFFKRITIYLNGGNDQEKLSSTKNWSIFTGTPGPNRKAIVYKIEDGKGYFVKVALGERALKLLENEFVTLDLLRHAKRINFSFPEVTDSHTRDIKITDVSENGNRSEFTNSHQAALLEIRNETCIPSTLQKLEIWTETKEKLHYLNKNLDPRIPKGLLRKLTEIILTIQEDQFISCCLSHGDFTPWNMYLRKNGTLAIYDWELSRNEMPLGFDAFHFIIQDNILVKRNSWNEIQQKIKKTLFGTTDLLGSFSENQQQLYLKLYLVINTVFYLHVYHEQKKWHTQITWLINTWNEALSSLLAPKRSNRELVIMDTIDFLHDKNYAALKYHNDLPEKLGEFSDMDFSIDRNHYLLVSKFLSQHSLINHRQVVKKSFMASEHLVMQDGSMLSLDFIWQMKRKHIEMLDNTKVLSAAEMGVHGVKVASPEDNARYVGFFHALNNAPIPTKYKHYRVTLTKSESTIDCMLTDYFNDELERKKEIAHYIKLKSSNRGLKGFMNWFNYQIDLIREIMSAHGMVITFSGVDGAGKSTVIENLKQRIEKQLRKRVVVLRHRPSLLPILSAWTKGKAVAEKEAASKLPRQGENKSKISSLLRFGYYYSDYLIGQWYIMFKYVLRGYVVLYDRYYFDFINDSRRSNIELPSFITQFGYMLVKEPDLNFFLYAKPELILSRKKELDKNTIEELTTKYLELFSKLNKKRIVQKYIPIENIELDITLRTIMGKMSPTL